MHTLYIVRGRTGEYSDRHEWAVKAFCHESDARALVEKASGRARELELLMEDLYNRDVEGKNEYDPHMHMDYTGTYYDIEVVELEGSCNGPR